MRPRNSAAVGSEPVTRLGPFGFLFLATLAYSRSAVRARERKNGAGPSGRSHFRTGALRPSSAELPPSFTLGGRRAIVIGWLGLAPGPPVGVVLRVELARTIVAARCVVSVPVAGHVMPPP